LFSFKHNCLCFLKVWKEAHNGYQHVEC
jgi:hypothetical protein